MISNPKITKKIKFLEERIKFYNLILKSIDKVIFRVDPKNGEILEVLGNTIKLFGVKKVEILKNKKWLIDKFCCFFVRALIQKEKEVISDYTDINGNVKKIRMGFYSIDGHFFIVCDDFTNLWRIQEEIEREKDFLNSIINSIPQGIVLLDPKNLKVLKYKTSIHTKAFCEALGVAEGVSLYDTLPQNMLNFIKHYVDEVWMAGGYKVIPFEINFENLNAHLQLTFVKTGKWGVIIVVNDLTELTELKKKYEYLSLHDPLTNLPNRRYIIEQLKQLIIQAKRHNRKVAVLFVDVDNFKYINDTYGHDVGDEFLKNISRCLIHSLRPGDLVGRMGGDEFIIVLDDVAKVEDIQMVCRRILENCKNFKYNDIKIVVTMSIGISVYPDDSENYEELIKFADIAMYNSKQKGKNTFEFYSKELAEKLKQRIEMINKIVDAIEKEKFVVFYQPILDISRIENFNQIKEEIINKDLVIGFEALVRWFEDGKLIPPLSFIPLAEENNLIFDIGKIVLRKSMNEMKNINKMLFVNASAKEFEHPLYFDTLLKIVEETNFNPSKLNIEITESLIIRNIDYFVKMSSSLINRGTRICIDDFGSGYSSFSSLVQLPANMIKIDRSFVAKIEEDEKVRKIVKTMVDIAYILGFDVVAEGVETIEQLKILQELNCKYAQGFLFFKPMPLEELLIQLAPARN